MAILISIKKESKSTVKPRSGFTCMDSSLEKPNNVFYLEDYRKKKSISNTFFSNKLTELNRKIATNKGETDDIEREIAEYEKKSEEIAKDLKKNLHSEIKE